MLTVEEYINSYEMNGDINRVLFNKIKEHFGNKCHEAGYILKESIQLIQRSLGKIQTINDKSSILYIIKFKCKLINPSIEDNIEVVINNINKMGIISYYKIDNLTTLENSPLLIIIPYEEIKNKPYKEGDKINIVVESVRIKHSSTQIQIIGKLKKT